MLGKHIIRCRGQHLTIGPVACALCEQTCGGGKRGKAQSTRGAGKILLILGGIAFVIVAKLLRVTELEQAFGMMRRKLGR